MKYSFELNNLTNDKIIMVVALISSETINQAMRKANLLDPNDIGIRIVESEG